MNEPILTRATKITLAVVFTAMLLTACNLGGDNTNAVEQIETNSTNHFVLTLSQFNGANMRLTKLEPHDFYQTVKATGIIEVPPQNKVTVSAYFGGYVSGLNLLLGEEVSRGKVLFTLENPQFVQVQQDFLETKGQLNYLKSDYERQQNLVEENVTSQKSFLKAEADYKVALARFEALKKQLGLMNISTETLTDQNIRTSIAIRASISGYVTEVSINNGMFLNPSDKAISLVNLDHLHVELSIFEKDLPMVSVGQPIKFRLPNVPRQFDARVELINKSVDIEKRIITVHAHLVNEDDIPLFTPGQFVEADIHTTGSPAPALPEEAIVQIDNQYFVLIKTDQTSNNITLEQREVEIGRTTAGYTEITNADTFVPETEFLTSGAFDLISE